MTSKLIVMKNINKELIKYQSYILDVYEKVKIANRSDYPGLEPEPDYPDYPGNLNQTKDYESGENEENFDEAESFFNKSNDKLTRRSTVSKMIGDND